jgi:hypothetical protein
MYSMCTYSLGIEHVHVRLIVRTRLESNMYMYDCTYSFWCTGHESGNFYDSMEETCTFLPTFGKTDVKQSFKKKNDFSKSFFDEP